MAQEQNGNKIEETEGNCLIRRVGEMYRLLLVENDEALALGIELPIGEWL